ncbi:MAG: hypothetical protein ABJB74_01330 [Gemmatimonas sp.]
MPAFCRRALFAAAFVFLPCTALFAQGGATVSGAHASDEFCKTMLKQFDLSVAYNKANAGQMPGNAQQAKYIADQKALNAALVKTAPASLTSDITAFMKVADAFYDVQLAGRGGDPAVMKAANQSMRSPEHMAQSKRMFDYCGVKMAAPQ